MVSGNGVTQESDGLDEACACGHLHPEHSLSGPCHGCTSCDQGQGQDHPYVRCECPQFVPAATLLDDRRDVAV